MIDVNIITANSPHKKVRRLFFSTEDIVVQILATDIGLSLIIVMAYGQSFEKETVLLNLISINVASNRNEFPYNAIGYLSFENLRTYR